MPMTRKIIIILGLAVTLLLAGAGPILAQPSKSFTGKISEIAKGAELDIAKHGIYYIVRLDEYPNVQFRLSPDDAARYGLIDKMGPTGVVTPKMNKGVGWRVKITCDARYLGDSKYPTYMVTDFKKLSD